MEHWVHTHRKGKFRWWGTMRPHCYALGLHMEAHKSFRDIWTASVSIHIGPLSCGALWDSRDLILTGFDEYEERT